MAPRLPLALGALVALLLPVKGAAQCQLCPPPTSMASKGLKAPPRPLSLTITADLDISRVAAGPAGGAVDLDPQSSMRVTQGAVVELGGMPFTGAVEVRGEPGAVIRIILPDRIVLTGDTGGEVVVTDLRTNLNPVAQIGGDGTLTFRFGGRMQVSGDQEGTFRGRIPITADYL